MTPLHRAVAARDALLAVLMTEPEDGEWLWLCFWRLDTWIRRAGDKK